MIFNGTRRITKDSKKSFFEALKSRCSTLRRYMDFKKFASILEKSAVYFALANTLGDPFEGSYYRGTSKVAVESEPH